MAPKKCGPRLRSGGMKSRASYPASRQAYKWLKNAYRYSTKPRQKRAYQRAGQRMRRNNAHKIGAYSNRRRLAPMARAFGRTYRSR